MGATSSHGLSVHAIPSPLSSQSLSVEEVKRNEVERWSVGVVGYAAAVEVGLQNSLYSHWVDWLAPTLSGRGSVRVLDVASACGEPAISLAKVLPLATFVSTDVAPPAAELGRQVSAPTHACMHMRPLLVHVNRWE